MFDFNFDWKPELDTNIEILDKQNKQLFKIGRDMEQLLRFKCIGVKDKQLLEIVCELRNFAAYHFYEEELLMKEANYPDLAKHKVAHAEFTKFVMAVNLPAMKANPEKELSKLRDNLVGWIFEHMLVEDMKAAKEIYNREKVEV